MEMIFSISEIDQIAKKIVNLKTSKIIILEGEMGAGKTTLIKAIAKEMGVTDVANSPTFSIVNEYQTASGTKLFHFDLYRIEKEEEAYDIGIEDYLYSGNFCFIEWAERIPDILPEDHQKLQLEVVDEFTRKLTMV